MLQIFRSVAGGRSRERQVHAPGSWLSRLHPRRSLMEAAASRCPGGRRLLEDASRQSRAVLLPGRRGGGDGCAGSRAAALWVFAQAAAATAELSPQLSGYGKVGPGPGGVAEIDPRASRYGACTYQARGFRSAREFRTVWQRARPRWVSRGGAPHDTLRPPYFAVQKCDLHGPLELVTGSPGSSRRGEAATGGRAAGGRPSGAAAPGQPGPPPRQPAAGRPAAAREPPRVLRTRVYRRRAESLAAAPRAVSSRGSRGVRVGVKR